MKPSPSNYAPGDSGITLSSLEFLRTSAGAELRAQVAALLAQSPDPSVAQFTALRKSHPVEFVHAALALGQLQKKAAAKFPRIPYFWAVPEALEQATDTAVAQHKAARFATATPTRIIDLCAGIGGDTLALAHIAPTTAIEISPIRTACLRYNFQDQPPAHPIEILTTDLHTVLSTLPHDALFHIDPSRRNSGKRSPRYEDLIPGPETLAEIINHFPNGGAIKLSPAVDFDTLPEGHLEIISHDRSVVQATLWLGNLAKPFPPHTRTATMLHRDQFSYTAPSALPTYHATPARYLYEIDPAFTRSQLAFPLAQSLSLEPLTLDGGYLTSASLIQHPALTPFEILTTLHFSERAVSAALKDLPLDQPGPIEVKTRGALPRIDTDHLQTLFTKASPHRRTVLIFRQEKTIYAALANRLNSQI